ncbi:MAG TPA: pyruvate kinase [Candidatus Limnocylindrales bacterium]|nr:pyruvate kinase [Candidatus Limnocylindrales bacterium]
MRRTKIVCTLGPSSNSAEQIAKLIDAGMDVARINLSHGSWEDHCRQLDLVGEVSSKMKKTVGLLIDTRGPKVRTGNLQDGSVILEDGQNFILTTAAVSGNNKKVSVTYPDLHRDLIPGGIVLIDDGSIILRVLEISGEEIFCRVLHGGVLKSRKGLNMPGTKIKLPALNDADRADIKLVLEREINFLAVSFVRDAADVLEVRRLVEKLRGNVMIISKIECREGVENFDAILEVSDGVMVARGDLGVEIPPEEVPLLQKQFIYKCNRAGKPVITATQMLDSMIRNPRPTRAEASDVANAILDGTDAVMLSGETAVGRFPVETVQTMSRIAGHTEAGRQYKKILDELGLTIKKSVTDAISYATCHIANELCADAIITSTQSGHTARMVSKYKPRAPIVAVSARTQVAKQLTLTWGVHSILSPPVNSTDEMFSNAIQSALKDGLIKDGNLVVITAGVPVGVSGTTNLLRVETVGDVIVRGTGVGKSSTFGAAFVAHSDKDLEKMVEGQILVAHNTDVNYLPAIEKAAALVIEEGGLTSHGAIVAINLAKPAVVGVAKAVDLLKTGEIITVDAVRGLIYRGKANVL